VVVSNGVTLIISGGQTTPELRFLSGRHRDHLRRWRVVERRDQRGRHWRRRRRLESGGTGCRGLLVVSSGGVASGTLVSSAALSSSSTAARTNVNFMPGAINEIGPGTSVFGLTVGTGTHHGDCAGRLASGLIGSPAPPCRVDSGGTAVVTILQSGGVESSGGQVITGARRLGIVSSGQTLTSRVARPAAASPSSRAHETFSRRRQPAPISCRAAQRGRSGRPHGRDQLIGTVRAYGRARLCLRRRGLGTTISNAGLLFVQSGGIARRQPSSRRQPRGARSKAR